jgi:hypothetical protein
MVLHVIYGFIYLSCLLTFPCQEQEINDELEFLIIASDGLWGVVPNEVSLLSASVTFLEAQMPLYLLFFLGIWSLIGFVAHTFEHYKL